MRSGHTTDITQNALWYDTRRLAAPLAAKGLPVGMARPGQGRGRKRERPVGSEVEDAGQGQAPVEQVAAKHAMIARRSARHAAVVRRRWWGSC